MAHVLVIAIAGLLAGAAAAAPPAAAEVYAEVLRRYLGPTGESLLVDLRRA